MKNWIADKADDEATIHKKAKSSDDISLSKCNGKVFFGRFVRCDDDKPKEEVEEEETRN